MIPRSILTLDVGVTYDSSVLTRWCRLAGVSALNPGHDARPVLAVQVHVFPQGAPLIDVVNATLAVIERTRPAYVAIERSGVGAMPCQMIERTVRQRMPRQKMVWCSIHWGPEMKLAAYSLLRWLFERRQIVLRRDPVPLRQLAGVRVERAVRGAKIGAEDPSIHDDVADALAFGALPYTAKGGRIVCGLARLVDSETAAPEAEVPELDEPVTATGGELRLYERPPLQGIEDSQLWMPPGVEPKDPRLRARPEMVAAPDDPIPMRRKE
ncbi:MAG: hypothetical protein AABM42_03070 [Actinomycetota bacterium]